jgi:hypothetical protein
VSPLEHAVFEDLVVRRLDGASVAARHGITRNSVYLHKRHALARLRDLLQRWDADATDETRPPLPA